MAKNPDTPKKPVKNPKSKAPNSKASRPDVQPIGPALAELLNPAINRGESGIGSSTGLQPPPDNSKERPAGGEAAIHRARASTPKNFPESDPRPSSPPPRGGVTSEARSLGSGVGGNTGAAPLGSPPSPTLPHKGGGSREASGGGAEVQGVDATPQA